MKVPKYAWNMEQRACGGMETNREWCSVFFCQIWHTGLVSDYCEQKWWFIGAGTNN